MKNWPAYSSGFNPIEHVWVHLKKPYYGYYLSLADDTRLPEVVKPLVKDAIIHCWELIPDSF